MLEKRNRELEAEGKRQSEFYERREAELAKAREDEAAWRQQRFGG